MDNCGKCNPVRRNCKCKGPEAEEDLACLRWQEGLGFRSGGSEGEQEMSEVKLRNELDFQVHFEDYDFS